MYIFWDRLQMNENASLVKIPVPYQCPFCTETVPNGLFSSPAVPDLYLWIPEGNSSQFSIGAEVPKLYPAQLGRTAELPRNRLGTPVISTHSVPQFRNCTLRKEGTAATAREPTRNSSHQYPLSTAVPKLYSEKRGNHGIAEVQIGNSGHQHTCDRCCAE